MERIKIFLPREKGSCTAGGKGKMCDDGSEGAEQGAGVCSAAGSWDGVRNRPWHQADCYQRFARRTQPHFWELFLALT